MQVIVSPMQKRVIDLINEGLPYSVAGERLGKSRRMVGHYMVRIFRRVRDSGFDISDRSDLAKFQFEVRDRRLRGQSCEN